MKTTIDKLNQLRAESTQGEWRQGDLCVEISHVDRKGIKFTHPPDTEYVHQLHNAYPNIIENYQKLVEVVEFYADKCEEYACTCVSNLDKGDKARTVLKEINDE